jgi:hypothetical protein
MEFKNQSSFEEAYATARAVQVKNLIVKAKVFEGFRERFTVRDDMVSVNIVLARGSVPLISGSLKYDFLKSRFILTLENICSEGISILECFENMKGKVSSLHLENLTGGILLLRAWVEYYSNNLTETNELWVRIKSSDVPDMTLLEAIQTDVYRKSDSSYYLCYMFLLVLQDVKIEQVTEKVKLLHKKVAENFYSLVLK